MLSPGCAGGGNASGGSFCVAQCQSSANTYWMLATTGPRISMCVSRHGDSRGFAPRYSTPTLWPPTNARLPSTTTILRWLRKLSWKRLTNFRLVANG